MYAAGNGKNEICQLLVGRGANVNSKNEVSPYTGVYLCQYTD